MICSPLAYSERASYCLSAVSQRLLQLLDEKETNIALSADVTRAQQLIDLADAIGPEIAVLKTHMDVIEDFTPALIQQLRYLAQKHHFLLFEDRKFADIGHTVKHQYEGGIYQICDWADIVTAHALPGPGLVKGLADVGRKKNRGVFLIAELSSNHNLITPTYTASVLRLAEQFADFAIGFIAQHCISSDPHWITMTPGIQLKSGKDKLGQQYKTPEKAILENGTDIIIVGRGILSAQDPIAEAQKYREIAWNSYLKRKES